MKNFRLWLRMALYRALRSVCQNFITLVTVGQALKDIDWIFIISTSCVIALLSICNSIISLPEYDKTEII